MELLVIPLVLAIGAFYLNKSERAVDRQIAEDRAKLEREIATDRQQEAALQAYLDRMADLLMNNEFSTSSSKEMGRVGRMRTLAVLQGLDARRKGFVLLFLQEAGLIDQEGPIINLENADLGGADLSSADLGGADMSKADLRGANLYHAKLNDTDLTEVNLIGVDLEGAYLVGANLSRANLSLANLNGADLSIANLGGADLTAANLSGAEVTDEQLAAVESLMATTMPDGTKHD